MKKILAALICLFLYTATMAEESGFIYYCKASVHAHNDALSFGEGRSRDHATAILNSFMIDGEYDYTGMCNVRETIRPNSYKQSWTVPYAVVGVTYSCAYTCETDSE